jgi:hypothetical protein
MKGKAGLIVPVLMMVAGAYALMTTLGTSGDQVTLISDHEIPRGLAMIFGLIGLGGGGVVLATSLTSQKKEAPSA